MGRNCQRSGKYELRQTSEGLWVARASANGHVVRAMPLSHHNTIVRWAEATVARLEQLDKHIALDIGEEWTDERTHDDDFLDGYPGA